MKKYVVLFVMALTLAACSGAEPAAGTGAAAGDAAAGDTAAGGTAAAADDTQADTVTTFTVLAGSGKSWDNPVARALTEATGVELEFQLIVGDANERIALMTAAGEFTDIVMTPNIAAMTMMIRANALVPLDDLFETHGPNLLAMYGQYLNRMRHSLEFPYIYSVGTGVQALGAGGQGRHWGEGFWIQNRALREQGFPQISTLQDFEDAIRRDIEMFPYNADGLPRFGLSINATEGWRFYFSLTRMPQIMNGQFQGEFIIDDTVNEFVLAATQPWFEDYMRWKNRLWNEGLIDPESFTQDYGTYLAKLSSGRVAGNIDAFWQFWDVTNEMVTSGRDDYAFMPFDIFAEPGIRYNRPRFTSVAYNGGFSITTAASDPAKIVQFFDFLASEEGNILTRWGIEGINYTIGPDGFRIRDPQDVQDVIDDHVEFQERTGVAYFTGGVNEWLNWPTGFLTSNGQDIVDTDAENAAAMFGDVEREVLGAYGLEFFTDVFVNPATLPVYRYGSLGGLPGSDDDFVIMAQSQFSEMYFPGIVSAIIAAPGEFDNVWDGFLAAIDATNIQIHLNHLNQELQNRRILWGID
jgi:putative aldouronate transport system substrate-binding protein